MKFKIFIVLILLIYSGNSSKFSLSKSSKFSELITEVLSDLVDHFYLKHEVQFEINYIQNSSSHLDDIVNGIGRKYVTKVRGYNRSEMLSIHNSGIILFNDLKDFLFFWLEPKTYEPFPLNASYIVYIKNLNDLDSLDKILKTFLSFKSLEDAKKYSILLKDFTAFNYFYFVIKIKSQIYLATFEWYSKKHCNIPHLKVLNIFDKSSKIWKNQLKFERKFRNFYNCKISFFIPTDSIEVYFDHFGKLQGSLVEINKAIAKVGNFQAEIFFGAETVNYFVDVIQQLESILTKSKIDQLTSVYWHQDIVFYITPAEQYTQWEKVTLPFDLSTWIWMMVVFGLAFGATLIINRMSSEIRNLFLGSSAKYPAYNILGTFFGISQTRSPEGNFGRFILMIFILFCLVMRTAYQGETKEFF